MDKSLRNITYYITILILLIFGRVSIACNPQIYFLFRNDAQAKLDSLNQIKSQKNLDKAILLHNLAFHKDREARIKAEDLLNKLKLDSSNHNIIQAYKGSLKMIKVSLSSPSSKILKSISPFGKSPKEEARDGFALISKSVFSEPNSKLLRCLRATAATEGADHLQELFAYAKEDLIWLETNSNTDDSVANFFINLNWTKYYYKLGEKEKNKEYMTKANDFCKKAIKFSCTPVYLEWAKQWAGRIGKALKN